MADSYTAAAINRDLITRIIAKGGIPATLDVYRSDAYTLLVDQLNSYV
jgi:hypothetical protein